jgi:hypothetical protein
MLAFLIAIGEGLLRIPAVSSSIPVPSVGTNFRSLDIKLSALDIQAAQDEIDCIIIGSSMPLVGIDPDMLEQELGIRCFNFSLNGMSALGAGTLGQILAWRYKPNLLIYATDLRAFVETESTLSWRQEIIEAPWTEYQLGQWSFEGWLLSHSALYAELAAFSFWTSPFDDWFIRSGELTDINGYQPHLQQKIDVRQGLTEEEIEGRDIYASLQDYRLEAEETAGLEMLSELPDETELILIEMPVHESFFLYMGNGQEDRRIFIDELEDFSIRNGVPFIASYGSVHIPDDLWADRNHMIKAGATLFTQWLAGEIQPFLIQETSR